MRFCEGELWKGTAGRSNCCKSKEGVWGHKSCLKANIISNQYAGDALCVKSRAVIALR